MIESAIVTDDCFILNLVGPFNCAAVVYVIVSLKTVRKVILDFRSKVWWHVALQTTIRIIIES